MTNIDVEITRVDGFPVVVAARKPGSKLEMIFKKNENLRLKGTPRSFDDAELFRALQFVYSAGAISDPKISPLTLIESGKFHQSNVGPLQNGTATLYTVPTTQKFYLYYYDFDVEADNTAVAIAASIYYNDNLNNYNFSNVAKAAGSTGWHHSVGFNFMKIPSGYTLGAYADANSIVYATIVGILV